MNRAEITAGAVHGSTSLTVTCAEANGTTVVVYRNTFWLGNGVLAAGVATVNVPALATGDIIQASVTERGGSAGAVVVVRAATMPTGWYAPASVNVNGVVLTSAAYEALYGYKPLAAYDPAVLVPVIAPEVPAAQAPTYPAPTILFDLLVDRQVGKTVVTVHNVQYVSGGTLVRFATGDAWTNVLTKEYTANATITVQVKGTSDADALAVSKSVSVTVFAPSPAVPVASDIIAFSYQKASDAVTVYVNSLKDCETRILGFSSTWLTVTRYGTDFMNRSISGIAPGNYTLQVRVSGDATTDNWKSVPISF